MTQRSPTARRARGSVLLWLLVALLLLLLVGTFYLLREPLLRGFAHWWVVDDPLEKAQAIVVLGGDNPAGDRVRHAVRLYRAGWAPRVVLSGVSLRTYFNEVNLMEREATEQGVPREHLVLAPLAASSTVSEALALRPVLAQHHFRKIIVVTSNYHTRRARAIFLRLYQPQGTQVLVSAAPDSNFNPEVWWRERDGRVLMLLEWQKMFYSWWELRDPPRPQGTFLFFAWERKLRYSG